MRERKSLGKMMRSLLLCLTLYCSLVYANISDALDYAALDKQFLFGASTASYQIEGAVNKGERGKTIWDVFSHIKNKTYHGDTGDDADKSYDLYAEDVKLLQQLNVQSYRFSIAWSRIITEDGEVNEAGVAHYVRILQLLRTANIKPVVTLYHWDLPVQFSTMSADSQSHYRGWLDRSIVDPFVLYAKVCFERFSPYVFRWITFNEPWSFCHLGYGEGVHAPGRCSDRAKCPEGDSATEQYLCGHNVLLAHAYTVQLYRENAARFNPSGSTQIGMTINIDYTYANSTKAEDIEAAQRFLEFLGGWFADPLYFGRYPDSMRARVGSRLPEFSAEEQQLLIGSNDYFGLNHYSSKWVEDIPRGGKDSRDSNTDSSRGSGSSSGAGTANPRTSDDDDSSTNAYYVGNADAGEDNADPWMRDSGCNTFQTRPSGEVIGKAGASDWLKAVPSGFEGVLVWVSERYGHPPIVVTENGCDVIGESSTPLPQVLEDDFRVEYYSSYLRAMVAAVKEKGVNMQGYYAWSLLDNYEWAEGYSKRFGLYYVDYSSSERIRHAKKSVGWYANMVQGFRDYLDNAAVAAPAQPLESEDASTVRGASELAPTEATPVVTTSSITVASRSIKTQLESDSGSQPDFPRPDWAGDSEAEDGDGNTAREKVGDDSEGDNVNDDGNDNHTDDETDDGDGDGDGGGDGDDDGTGKHSTQNPGVNSEAHSHDVLVKLTVCVYIVICLIFTLVCYVLLRKFSLRNLNRLMGDATHKHSRWESLDRNGKYHRKRNSSYNYRQYSSSSSSSSGASYQAHAYAQTGYEYGYANDDTSAQNLLTSNFQSQLPLDYQ